MSKQIIVRHAHNDFEALILAQGMERAGCDVLSISFNGMHQNFGALLPSATFAVFGKYEPPVTPDSIDASIEAEQNQ